MKFLSCWCQRFVKRRRDTRGDNSVTGHGRGGCSQSVHQFVADSPGTRSNTCATGLRRRYNQVWWLGAHSRAMVTDTPRTTRNAPERAPDTSSTPAAHSEHDERIGEGEALAVVGRERRLA
jgi:hypothetical protein